MQEACLLLPKPYQTRAVLSPGPHTGPWTGVALLVLRLMVTLHLPPRKGAVAPTLISICQEGSILSL